MKTGTKLLVYSWCDASVQKVGDLFLHSAIFIYKYLLYYFSEENNTLSSPGNVNILELGFRLLIKQYFSLIYTKVSSVLSVLWIWSCFVVYN